MPNKKPESNAPASSSSHLLAETDERLCLPTLAPLMVCAIHKLPQSGRKDGARRSCRAAHESPYPVLLRIAPGERDGHDRGCPRSPVSGDLGFTPRQPHGVCPIGQSARQWSAMGTRQMRLSLLERSLAVMDRLARWRGRKLGPEHLQVGTAGEEAAFFYLRRKGYTVVAHRWTAGRLQGDIDLIAWEGSLLCVVEVKTRTAHDMTPAEAAVDRHKQHILRRLARAYVRQL